MKQLLIILFILSFGVQAKKVTSSGNWVLEDTSSRKEPNGTCIAYTVDDEDSLEIRLKKNQPAPLEIYITSENYRNKQTALMITLPTSENLVFVNMGKIKRTRMFYNIPSANIVLINTLKNGSSLSVEKVFEDDRKPRMKFSSRGFSRILRKMEERCNNNQSIVDLDFERSLLGDSSINLNPQAITLETAKSLKNLVNEAHSLYVKKDKNQSKINNLVIEFQAEIKRANDLISKERSLRTALEVNKQNQVQNDERQVAAESELSRLKPLIVDQKELVREATRIKNNKELIISPHRPEHSSLSKKASSNRSIVNNLEADLSEQRSVQRRAIRNLDDLRGEKYRLEGRIDSDDDSLRGAQSRLRSRRNAHDRFNVYDEVQDDLRSNYNYREAKREKRTAQTSYDEAKRNEERQRARGKKYSRELQTCRQSIPAKDCSALQRQVQESGSELKRLKDIRRSKSSRISSASSRIRRIETNAENRAKNEKKRLREDMDEAQRVVDRLEDSIRVAEKRVYKIVTIEIPNDQRSLDRAVKSIPLIESERDSMEPIAKSSEIKLSSFEDRVDWNSKLDALILAQSDLNDAVKVLSSSEQNRDNQISTIHNSKQKRIELIDARVSLNKTLDTTQIDLTNARRDLEPYHAKRIDLNNIKDNYQRQIEMISENYLSYL